MRADHHHEVGFLFFFLFCDHGKNQVIAVNLN
jgi:hypothetical protein